MQRGKNLSSHYLIIIFWCLVLLLGAACLDTRTSDDLHDDKPTSNADYKSLRWQKIVTVNELRDLATMSSQLQSLKANALTTNGDEPDPTDESLRINRDLIANRLGDRCTQCEGGERKQEGGKAATSSASSQTYWTVTGALVQPLRDPWARRAFRRLVSCALDPDDVVVWSYGTESEEFEGEWGLCRDWVNNGIETDHACQEIVSACVVSRMNAESVKVSIYQELPKKSGHVLESSGWSEYTYQEGAYFGTIYRGLDSNFKVIVQDDHLVYIINGVEYSYLLPFTHPGARLAFHRAVLGDSGYGTTPYTKIYSCTGPDYEHARVLFSRPCAAGYAEDSRCITTSSGPCSTECIEDVTGYYNECGSWEWPIRIRLIPPDAPGQAKKNGNSGWY